MNGSSVVCEDGIPRCPWGVSPPECRRHHDEEWGRPEGDDNRIFEKLCLEGFQSGLSWLTILRKLDGFRAAFAGFDPTEVAQFDESDVGRLLADPRIVRHRAKVVATIGNARALLALQRTGTSLAAMVWRYEQPDSQPPAATAEVPSSTAESEALAAELRRLGFRYLGPISVYAAMQDLGVVNDHLIDCGVRDEVEDERSRFVRPA